MCDTCNLVYHLACLDPPLTVIPKGIWSCPRCKVSYWSSSAFVLAMLPSTSQPTDPISAALFRRWVKLKAITGQGPLLWSILISQPKLVQSSSCIEWSPLVLIAPQCELSSSAKQDAKKKLLKKHQELENERKALETKSKELASNVSVSQRCHPFLFHSVAFSPCEFSLLLSRRDSTRRLSSTAAVIQLSRISINFRTSWRFYSRPDYSLLSLAALESRRLSCVHGNNKKPSDRCSRSWCSSSSELNGILILLCVLHRCTLNVRQMGWISWLGLLSTLLL